SPMIAGSSSQILLCLEHYRVLRDPLSFPTRRSSDLSFYIESLTDKIEANVNHYLEQIKEMGGAVQAIEDGFIQREIHQNAYETQKKIERGEEIIVGLNRFQQDEDLNPDLLKVDEALEDRQKKAVETIRNERDQDEVNKNLKALKKAARTDSNLIPYILDAVKAYATVGEICQVLREEFGEYTG